MSTQGVGTYKLNAFWESGRLIYYEKAYGHTTTGDVFILGHDYVQIGDTANDVDFAWKGTTTGTFTLDAAAHTLAMTGMATSTDGAVTITNATATSSTTTGALIVTGGIATAADIFCGDDLFFASTGVINFGAGDVTITGATNALAFAGASVGVTFDGVIAVNVAALANTDGRIATFKGTQATPNMADGYGLVETEITVTGTATGQINATSTWINLGTSAIVPGYITLHTDGIWDGTATLTTAMVSMQKYTCQLASNPAWLSIWELNFQQDANNIIDAMFNTNDLARGLGYVAATPTAAAIASIPFCSTAGGAVKYIRLYADATT